VALSGISIYDSTHWLYLDAVIVLVTLIDSYSFRGLLRFGVKEIYSPLPASVFFIACTAATSCLLYQPQMVFEGDCGAIGGMKIGRGIRSTRRKPAQAPLCPQQNPLDLTRDRTRTFPRNTTVLSYGNYPSLLQFYVTLLLFLSIY
jgi:hypothetical protein